MTRRRIANDHEPLNRTCLPEFLLGRLIRVPIETGIAYSGKVFRGVENIDQELPPQMA